MLAFGLGAGGAHGRLKLYSLGADFGAPVCAVRYSGTLSAVVGYIRSKDIFSGGGPGPLE